ncbi:MAG TPA: TolC family protein [Puia sp.]|nr:TolC family protein [Puia sp.]
MKKLSILPCICLFVQSITAQDKWDLKRCVEYAVNNNISVKQTDVQARLAELTFKQAQLSQIPLLSLGGNISYSSGQSQDPATFALITSGLWSSQYFVQSSVNVYNFNSLHNTIAGSRLAYQAADEATEKLKNDVSLNVANAYLNALLSVQTANAAELQLRLSQSQLSITQKQVSAGTLPELNAAEIESQVAQDSSSYVTDRSSAEQAILNLKAYMSLDAATPFDIATPPVEQIPIENISDLQPEMVYGLALKNQPLQKSDQLYVESGERFVVSNRQAMYPTLALFGQFYTTFTNQTYQSVGSFSYLPQIGVVSPSGASVYAVDSAKVPILQKTPYFTQLNQNFRQTIGVSLNIPILNGGTLRTSYARAKLNLRNYKLQQQADNLALKQNIYGAYALAIAALQKFESQKKTLEATQKSFDFAQKRYNVGLLNTIDLLTNQNNYFKAKVDLLSDQFDFVFKMKVLEFYKGMGIRL